MKFITGDPLRNFFAPTSPLICTHALSALNDSALLWRVWPVMMVMEQSVVETICRSRGVQLKFGLNYYISLNTARIWFLDLFRSPTLQVRAFWSLRIVKTNIQQMIFLTSNIFWMWQQLGFQYLQTPFSYLCSNEKLVNLALRMWLHDHNSWTPSAGTPEINIFSIRSGNFQISDFSSTDFRSQIRTFYFLKIIPKWIHGIIDGAVFSPKDFLHSNIWNFTSNTNIIS